MCWACEAESSFSYSGDKCYDCGYPRDGSCLLRLGRVGDYDYLLDTDSESEDDCGPCDEAGDYIDGGLGWFGWFEDNNMLGFWVEKKVIAESKHEKDGEEEEEEGSGLVKQVLEAELADRKQSWV